jgi:hypothetical protein
MSAHVASDADLTTAIRDTALFIAAATGSTAEAVDAIRNAEQRRLGSSSRLPTDCGINGREILEAAGVTFGEQVDGDRLFTNVRLPYRWSITSNGSPFYEPHSLHSFLRDGLSRFRSRITYCPEWYDRTAQLFPMTRYSARRFHHHKGAIVFVVYDGIRPQFSTEPRPYTEEEEYSSEYFAMEREARKEAETWLDERFSDWKNPAAYWD